jgi:ketosteroid isomerase-like protein
MIETRQDPRVLLERLIPAVNQHDLEGLVACFQPDYAMVNPAHPQQGFHGNEQVRGNWSQIFGAVPDIQASVLRSAVDGDTLWTEWAMSGRRIDGGEFDMRGVFIFGVVDGRASWARMFLEPVEPTGENVDAAVSRLVGETPAQAAGQRS